jgi:hypothetical protein
MARSSGRTAPNIAVQPRGPVSPEQPFMGVAANGWGEWICDDQLGDPPGYRTSSLPRALDDCRQTTMACFDVTQVRYRERADKRFGG